MNLTTLLIVFAITSLVYFAVILTMFFEHWKNVKAETNSAEFLKTYFKIANNLLYDIVDEAYYKISKDGLTEKEYCQKLIAYTRKKFEALMGKEARFVIEHMISYDEWLLLAVNRGMRTY